MATAAATSHGRRRRHEERVKQLSRHRAKIAHERQELKLHAREVFADLTDNGEWLPESDLRAFFITVFHTRKLDPNAVQLVVDTVTKKMKTSHDNDKPGYLSKEALVESVTQYYEYTSKSKMIEEIFQTYDKAGSGSLGRSDLLRLLQDQERKARRAAKGIAITLIVSPKDIEYVLEHADVDRDGDISGAELLPALATWDELVQEKLAHKQMAACCVIL